MLPHLLILVYFTSVSSELNVIFSLFWAEPLPLRIFRHPLVVSLVSPVSFFKNTKNLFIHIAHYPVRRFLRDIPTFLKCPLLSLVGEGVGNDRYQGDSAHETQPTRSLFTISLTRVEVLLDCSRFQLLLLLILLISLTFLIPFSPQSDLSAL